MNNSINAPKGFLVSNVAAKIKYENRDDMAIIVSNSLANCAATFTKNKVKAAPVIWDKKIVDNDGKVKAILVNAGIANAATGKEGLSDVKEIMGYVSKKLNVEEENIIMSSTGVIGIRLPVEKIKNGVDYLIKNLSNEENEGHRASKTIMTTDTMCKEAFTSIYIDDKEVKISGICKGSGMIHPNMGTMLSFITTDCNIDSGLLKKALTETVDDTYNMISVDGDTSTNDSCIILANGEANNKKIDEEDENYKKFIEALFYINKTLAEKIAMDGEGATKLLEVIVKNARTKDDAKKIAKSIVSSNLVKTAIYGKDPNWGRIICAIGYSKADFMEDKIDINLESKNGEIKICKNSVEIPFDEKEAKNVMDQDHLKIICNMNDGMYSATSYGCDLTHKYIDINASYRS